MSIRIPVTLVIEMDDEQQAVYAEYEGRGDRPHAQDFVDSVRQRALSSVRDHAPFAADPFSHEGGATVTIKKGD